METVAPAAPPIRPAASLPTGAALGTRVPGQAQPKRGEGRALTSTPTAVGVRHPQPRQPEPRQPLRVKSQRPLFEARGTARRASPPKPRAGAALTPPRVPGPTPCSTTGSWREEPRVADARAPEVVLSVDGDHPCGFPVAALPI